MAGDADYSIMGKASRLVRSSSPTRLKNRTYSTRLEVLEVQ